MYALHPGSLPPRGPKAKERLEVTAEDLQALYGLQDADYIVWNPADHYEWFDFIHLYPSYYDRYTLSADGIPEKDLPHEADARICPGTPHHRTRSVAATRRRG